LNDFADEIVNPQFASLKRQGDKKIEYFFILSTDTDPADPWNTQELKEAHQGDLKYLTDTQEAFRYAKDGGWYEAADMTEALSKAAKAKATADGKSTVYYDLEPSSPKLGDLWVQVGGITKTWVGSQWADTTNPTANQAYGWASGASKIITDPNKGGIIGWSFASSSNAVEPNIFQINAEKFRISNSSNSAQPFTIDPTGIYFNGKVSFSNVTGLGSLASKDKISTDDVTTIDGGKITTGTLDASVVNVTNINADNIKAGKIYNSGGTPTNYTMMIDLDNGEIHIV